jgi:hypothetical protein
MTHSFLLGQEKQDKKINLDNLIQIAYINDYSAIDIYLIGRELENLGKELQQKVADNIFGIVEELGEPSIKTDLGLLTVRTTKQYMFPSNDKINSIERLIEERERLIKPQVEEIKTLNKNIKTIKEQLIQNGEAFELEPTRTISFKYE